MPNSVGYCSCGSASDDLNLEDVTITPAGGTVSKGSNITVAVTGSDSVQVTGGSVTIKVKYGIITLLSHTYDLCTLLAETPYPCPVAPFTTKTISISEMIPSEAPSGKYSGSASAVDQSGNQIACINFAFSVK